VKRVQVPLADVLVLTGVLGDHPDGHLVGFNQATNLHDLSPFPILILLRDILFVHRLPPDG
jgi:hypothetical protein